ncbi:putative leucine-rich repeat receptor-like protein kinase [Heracleum sosnowskyi]|uniref:Leucine-rich repeat receptor-like protein kinase n=1 Tax=Heracleum sosnowskyi TaxID=360622 RepID=A0AAD8NC13_9APIA|nr:putative leucine-rich repeat receptor-like protein kinase [Heracleum sosnowskyi]
MLSNVQILFIAFHALFVLKIVSFEVTEHIFYPFERDALIQLREMMNSSANLHAKWTGVPCHKNQTNWNGIACENWHVTHLVLENIQLAGSLPPAFLQNLTFLTKLSFRNNSVYGQLPNLTNLINLEQVFLSKNSFSGSIPFHYIQLPRLKSLELEENVLVGEIPPFDQESLVEFNVSQNHLSGLIPETRVLESFGDSSYDHNSGLCGKIVGQPCPVLPPAPSPSSTPSKHKKKKVLKAYIIALIAAAAVAIPLLVILVFMCYRKRALRKQKSSNKQGNKMIWSSSADDLSKIIELEFLDKERPAFNLDDLLRASAEVLGKGRLGTTYKALLENAPAVAVKRLKEMNSLSKKDFVQQMKLLGQMRHENIVHIVSFYFSKEEKLVVHEFVPDGSLFHLLHENRGVGRVPLNWRTRFLIIKDTAKGLNFLHHSLPSQNVPHGNLKSSNILITQQANGENVTYQSKLSDFGFLPLLPSKKSSENLAIAKCPEFAETKKLTHKADVYCFGIILLEVITGKIPGEITSGFRGEDGSSINNLSDWVKMVVNNDWSPDILDMEILSSKEGHEEMLKLTELALQCTDLAPESRPNMSQVLEKIAEIEQMSGDQQQEQIES